jgi:hypothetical protein
LAENKIRKVDSTRTNPKDVLPVGGPQSAGVSYDSGRKGLIVNPNADSADRLLFPETFFLSFNVPGGAAAADYDGVIPVPYGCEVVSVRERHQTAGSDAGAVTVMVKKVPSGTAKASGTDVLSAGISLKATADTVQTGSLHATAANKQLAAGDGLALVTTGVLTAVDGVSVTVELKRRPTVA